MTGTQGGERRSIKEVLETAPLYIPVAVERPTLVNATYPAALDVFCWKCRSDRCFSRWDDRTDMANADVSDGRPYVGTYVCRQCQSELVLIVEFVESLDQAGGSSIRKIGQRPALIEFTRSQYNDHEEHISPEDCYELNQAIGLMGHGVGVGSYVYLRRIMERLIEEAHKAAMDEAGWDEQAYEDAMRFHEKLPLLRGHIPDFLVDQGDIYSVLSKDLHELDERECIEYFPVLRLAIEAILDQKVAEAEMIAKATEANERLARLQARLQSASSAPGRGA
jgi:hypothetical protein